MPRACNRETCKVPLDHGWLAGGAYLWLPGTCHLGDLARVLCTKSRMQNLANRTFARSAFTAEFVGLRLRHRFLDLCPSASLSRSNYRPQPMGAKLSCRGPARRAYGYDNQDILRNPVFCSLGCG